MSTPEKPSLRAEFVLDERGVPKVHQEGGMDHYEIRLFVDGAPEDTHAVTYHLHETYYDPLREVRDRRGGFLELITSYGDFEVRAEIRGRRRTDVAVAGLTKALARTYGHDPPDNIRRAIEALQEE